MSFYHIKSGIPGCGCGKSQIARQVGQEIFDKRWREGEDLTFVATLNAETLDSLAKSYCSLARHFGITDNALANLEASRNLPEKIEYLKTLIFSKTKQFSNWLIIVDNVVDLSSVRGDLPPSGAQEGIGSWSGVNNYSRYQLNTRQCSSYLP